MKPISERERIQSDDSLKSEIRGIVELKGGYYLAGSKKGYIGIYESKELKLINKFKIKEIKDIFHLSKIKDDNLDLIGIASNLNDVIVISVFKKDN